MDNLFRLKTNAPSYKISVTEDYTRKERNKIKEKIEEAKRLNDEESRHDNNFIWRVRGCPRTSLYLKKIPWPNQPKPETRKQLVSS